MGSYGDLWRARLQMVRAGNVAMAAVGTLIGITFAVPAGATPRLAADPWLAAPLAAALITAAGNVANDIRDRHIDAAAHPDRPLPAGRIAVADAKAFAFLLAGLGLLEAWVAGGWPALAFAGVVVALLGLYEWRLKGWPLVGNVVVGLLVAATFPFGHLAAAPLPPWPDALWLLAAMALLATVGRELLKDLEDMDHDAGRATLPRRVGAAPTQAVAAVAVAAAVALSLWYRKSAGDAVWVLLAADLVFAAALVASVRAPGTGQRLLKVAMVLALAAYLLRNLLRMDLPVG